MSDKWMQDGKTDTASGVLAEDAAMEGEQPRDTQAEDRQTPGFDALKLRLDEIVEAVGDEGLPLEDALELYEEAVKLGLQASSLIEETIVPREEPEGTTLGLEEFSDEDSGKALDETPGEIADERIAAG